ncbi:MAG: ATP-dependent DNA ligase [Dehalococcoidia bacterium]|nr:ATP-dependent DNA ligase [Dehalococcoidia bacterium]
MQQRLHPAESRVRRLAQETLATFVAFDLLAHGQRDLRAALAQRRRAELVALLAATMPPLLLTPATTVHALAREWFDSFEGAGFDGVVAKRLDQPYVEGERVMVKVKHRRTADCVVTGFRWHKDEAGTGVGSLLLGLYDGAGVLHHVGHAASFTAAQRRAPVDVLSAYITADAAAGFGRGRTPDAPSRWSGGRDADWVRLWPELVCEVAFDQMQGDRFRHGSTFMRWRPDKPSTACGYDQLASAVPADFQHLFDSASTLALDG